MNFPTKLALLKRAENELLESQENEYPWEHGGTEFECAEFEQREVTEKRWLPTKS